MKWKIKKYTFAEMLIELTKDNEKEFINTNTGVSYQVKDDRLMCCGKPSILPIHSLFDSTMDARMFIEVIKPFKDRIERGDIYYFIDITNPENPQYTTYTGYDYDERQKLYNNFFETEAEAQKKLKEMLKVLEG